MGELIGRIIGAIIEAVIDGSREAISKKLREIADDVERGDFVSDDAIDRAKKSTDRIRDMQDKRN